MIIFSCRENSQYLFSDLNEKGIWLGQSGLYLQEAVQKAWYQVIPNF